MSGQQVEQPKLDPCPYCGSEVIQMANGVYECTSEDCGFYADHERGLILSLIPASKQPLTIPIFLKRRTDPHDTTTVIKGIPYQ